MNIVLKIEYDGSSFYGWQKQPNVPTIQGEIEKALSSFFKQKITIYGASRTDAFAHAKGQVANFFCNTSIDASKLKYILNLRLPDSIRIVASRSIDEGFHARKNAISKIYEYTIFNREIMSPFEKKAYFYPHHLDWEEIKKSLEYFLGEKDFAAFRGSKATFKNTVRKLYHFELLKEAEHKYKFIIEGSGFLKQMVRNIVGTLVEIGEGKRRREEINDIFASKDRKKAGRTLPASGLCLLEVKYPETIFEL